VERRGKIGNEIGDFNTLHHRPNVTKNKIKTLDYNISTKHQNKDL
jgi:hypothetical protein